MHGGNDPAKMEYVAKQWRKNISKKLWSSYLLYFLYDLLKPLYLSVDFKSNVCIDMFKFDEVTSSGWQKDFLSTFYVLMVLEFFIFHK